MTVGHRSVRARQSLAGLNTHSRGQADDRASFFSLSLSQSSRSLAMSSMLEVDLEKTPSKRNSGKGDRVGPGPPSHSSIEVDDEAPDSTFQSAYTAPPYPRPQADRDHQQESLTIDRERGDLTAHNLELIPNADHVAPGIRLDRGGNDYLFHNRTGNGRAQTGSTETEESVGEDDVGDELAEEDVQRLSSRDAMDKRSSLGGKASSSIDATGRSSNGAADIDEENVGSDSHDLFEDVGEGDLDAFDEKHVDPAHERVGGSGATSENASKGASVGHFGPRGEAIRECKADDLCLCGEQEGAPSLTAILSVKPVSLHT